MHSFSTTKPSIYGGGGTVGSRLGEIDKVEGGWQNLIFKGWDVPVSIIVNTSAQVKTGSF